MQYTIRGIPRPVDRLLRERAKKTGKSLNEVTIEALAQGVGEQLEPAERRDLSDIVGTWVRDAAVEKALVDQRRTEEDLWK